MQLYMGSRERFKHILDAFTTRLKTSSANLTVENCNNDKTAE